MTGKKRQLAEVSASDLKLLAATKKKKAAKVSFSHSVVLCRTSGALSSLCRSVPPSFPHRHSLYRYLSFCTLIAQHSRPYSKRCTLYTLALTQEKRETQKECRCAESYHLLSPEPGARGSACDAPSEDFIIQSKLRTAVVMHGSGAWRSSGSACCSTSGAWQW